jgi:hypothetical protein
LDWEIEFKISKSYIWILKLRYYCCKSWSIIHNLLKCDNEDWTIKYIEMNEIFGSITIFTDKKMQVLKNF